MAKNNRLCDPRNGFFYFSVNISVVRNICLIRFFFSKRICLYIFKFVKYAQRQKQKHKTNFLLFLYKMNPQRAGNFVGFLNKYVDSKKIVFFKKEFETQIQVKHIFII